MKELDLKRPINSVIQSNLATVHRSVDEKELDP